MESRFPFAPSRWLCRHLQKSSLRIPEKGVTPSAMQSLKRGLPVAADIAPVHQASSKFHQPTQYPPYAMFQCSLFFSRRTCSKQSAKWVSTTKSHVARATVTSRRKKKRQKCNKRWSLKEKLKHYLAGHSIAMFQCSLQYSGLTGHELHGAFDFLPRTVSLEQSGHLLCELVLLPLLMLQSLARCHIDCVVPELINEPRCSLCDPGELRSFPRNQHCPRHLASPFADDQYGKHL